MDLELIDLHDNGTGRPPMWKPVSGASMSRLRQHLIKAGELPNEEAVDAVEASSLRIVSQCRPPGDRGEPRTVLVVGYVQSGKTISMAAVTALARDNGFGLVVILAGTTENLLRQSWEDRFEPYLTNIDERQRDWFGLSTGDGFDEQARESLRNELEDWTNDRVPANRRRTIVVMAMKNHHHLEALASALGGGIARGVPTLVIDDEADQAGLNTSRDDKPSTTYEKIANLRGTLGRHTYLQYTATPQAPLLIALADMLSPDASVVLEAGEGYTGGETFFRERRQELVREIPREDLFKPGEPPSEAPDSLLDALRVFLVTVAFDDMRQSPLSKYRSMLVHPSPKKDDHKQYCKWIQKAIARWREELDLPTSDPDFADAREEFERAISDVRRTARDVPSFGALLPSLRNSALRSRVWVVNSETGAEVKWKQSHGHILVGGQKLNRGYTVEGLNVTYMPRPPGGWNADTIQQLGRFFGYKARYVDICRIWLHPGLLQAFGDYVVHEQHFRRQLRDHPGPLKEWKRAFFLKAPLRPTRKEVLRGPLYRGLKRPWVMQQVPHDSAVLDANRELVRRLYAHIGEGWRPHPRAPRHRAAELPLKDLLDRFFIDYRFIGGKDDVAFFAARCLLSDIAEDNPDERVAVVDMGASTRSVRNGQIVKLLQGYDRSTHGATYPGAARIVDDDKVTLQIHALSLTPERGRTAFEVNVPTLSLYLPDRYRKEVVTQGDEDYEEEEDNE